MKSSANNDKMYSSYIIVLSKHSLLSIIDQVIFYSLSMVNQEISKNY